MKIAVVAALAGLMLTVAILAAVSERRHAPFVAHTSPPAVTGEPSELERCRSMTVPDARCEQIWAERQRRFFRHEEKRR